MYIFFLFSFGSKRKENVAQDGSLRIFLSCVIASCCYYKIWHSMPFRCTVVLLCAFLFRFGVCLNLTQFIFPLSRVRPVSCVCFAVGDGLLLFHTYYHIHINNFCFVLFFCPFWLLCNNGFRLFWLVFVVCGNVGAWRAPAIHFISFCTYLFVPFGIIIGFSLFMSMLKHNNKTHYCVH